ncbi:tellurite resistance TerB family protein [Salinarimonas soli]|uniref:Tellurite resistance TerB family protein n=1 Tax=Salinarimonas soli TaxID=1638099 RepID=A0A5B2VC11_9HYPH|nr:tellurite resistance TerB family protein [Salinarimonas soli]KAA2236504.1 tellurite resistance TerB family protein [Salinarimonas soli]
MFDAKKLLDAVVGAVAKPGASGATGETLSRLLGQATQGLSQGAQRLDAATGSVGAGVNEAARSAVATSPAGDTLAKAGAYVRANPGLAEAALAGVAGLLISSRRTRGVAMNAAAVGGLALIGGLAYSAFQNSRSGRPILDTGAAGTAPALGLDAFPNADDPAPAHVPSPAATPPAGSAAPQLASASPNPQPGGEEVSRVRPGRGDVSDDDAVLLVRAMVAAASADGIVDQAERSRIISGLQQAGLDPDATGFLERELSQPADVEELAAGITDPDKAAQVYTAARLAIDPDTLQEREFLRRLQEALDLEDDLVAHIDAAAATVKGE